MNAGLVSCGSDAASDPIVNVAAYKFVPLDRLAERRQELRHLCQDLALKGTILLSAEGINLFLAGSREAIDHFLAVLRRDESFRDLEVKESLNDHQPFNQMLVKIKREIIAFGIESVRPLEHTSPKLPATELCRWLDEGKPITLLDVRNDYEIDLGTFENAVDLKIHHFRDFPNAANQLSAETRQQPLVMFCTGGIRCEKAGPMMEQMGFEQVYQLDGGILKYFEECGGKHYRGDCFVFDQRVAVDPNLDPTGAALCFACMHALTLEDQKSAWYQPPNQCPYCFQTEAQKRAKILADREARLKALVTPLPGCVPYTNEREIHVPARFSGLSMIDFLDQWHPGYTRDAWLKALLREEISLGGIVVTSDRVVHQGESYLHRLPNTVEPPVNPNVKILYEDEAIVVLHKPAPLPCHSSGRFHRNTLNYFLEKLFYPEKLRMNHRLDSHTSGLMLLSRRHAVAKRVQKLFADRKIEKIYFARVHGFPTSDQFECRLPIADQPGDRGTRRTDPAGGEALTRFRVVRRYSDGTTLLEVEPITGRTNQIRIHLWELGYPIVNDPMYRQHHRMQPPDPFLSSTSDALLDSAGSMQLLAARLRFDHPMTSQPMLFEAAHPEWIDVLDHEGD